MPTENNAAARAGDEPTWMTSDLSYVLAHLKENTIFDTTRIQREWDEMKALAIQARVSPRATAEVERNLRAELINEGALRQYCHNDGSAGFVTAYDFDITNRFLAAIATTKPGA